MTRYARAKGSKASNEREPEEATPWAQMVRGIRKIDNPEVEEEAEDMVEVDRDPVVPMQEDEVKADIEATQSDLEEADQKEGEKDDGDKSKKKRKRSKNKCLQCKEKGHLKMDCPTLSEERRKELRELVAMKIERKGKGTGRKKNKNKNNAPKEDNLNDGKVKKNNNKHSKRAFKDKAGQLVAEDEGTFQGFRVTKEDEKRLRKLQKDLEKQKLSKEELKEALKKERRRAEKSLARSKKMVCYHCRKPGHFLSECPDADKPGESRARVNNPGGGGGNYCFKCGSSEHLSKDCKSKRSGEEAFAFAVCFICKQTGHLAKACPDNPKGLYPNGGGCRFCGSVEHLKSDCSRKREKDARNEVVAYKMSFSRGLEVEEDLAFAAQKSKGAKMQTKKKVVSF